VITHQTSQTKLVDICMLPPNGNLAFGPLTLKPNQFISVQIRTTLEDLVLKIHQCTSHIS